MKLYTPAFERALKRGVRGAVRADPKLRKEYKRAKTRGRGLWTFWFLRLVLSALLAGSVSTVLNATGHAGTAFSVVVLWALAAACFLSLLLVPARLQGSSVRALQMLPVSDAMIYRYQRDKIVGFHSMLVCDLLAGLGTLTFLSGLPWTCWIALPLLALLAWVFNVALAMFLGVRFRRSFTGWFGLGIAVCFGAYLLGNKVCGPQMMAALDLAAPTLNLASPTAWPLEPFRLLVRGGWWPSLVGLPLTAYIIWSYRACEQMAMARFVYREPAVLPKQLEQIPEGMTREQVVNRPPTVVPGGAQEIPEGLAEGFDDRPIGVTAIADGILSRECFALPQWNRDWVQRLLWRWFSPREKVLASFVFPFPLEFVKPWSHIARHFLIAILIWQAVRLLIPAQEPLVLIFAFAIPGLEMLWRSWQTGASFRQVRNYGVQISLLAPYPVSFHELSMLLLKCAAIQLPAMAVVLVVLAMSFAGSHELSLIAAAWVGLRLAAVFFALRIGLLVLSFASLSNDTSRFGLRALLSIFAAGVEIVVFVGLAGVVLFVPDGAIEWIAAAALIAFQVGLLLVYGWLWARGSIDLVSSNTR